MAVHDRGQAAAHPLSPSTIADWNQKITGRHNSVKTESCPQLFPKRNTTFEKAMREYCDQKSI